MLFQADQQVSPRCVKNHLESVIASASTSTENNTNSTKWSRTVIPTCLVISIFGILTAGAVWYIWRCKSARKTAKIAIDNTAAAKSCQKQPLVEMSCPESILPQPPQEWVGATKENVFKVMVGYMTGHTGVRG